MKFLGHPAALKLIRFGQEQVSEQTDKLNSFVPF